MACILALAAGTLSAQPPVPQAAQPAAPPARATVVAPTEPAQITVAHRGVNAEAFLTVKAANSDVRKTLTDMADKSGLKLILASSAMGVVSGSVEGLSADDAFKAVAGWAGLSVRKLIVPSNVADTLTPEIAGRYTDALGALPVGASVADLTTGRSVTVGTRAPEIAAGQTAVYYVQGKLSPEQERLAMARRAAEQATALTASGQQFVAQAQKSLQQMSLQQRMEAIRALQRGMFEGMTDAERQQMRQMMPGRGDRGWGGRGQRGNN
jgi:hypothetical protein